jgi:hypothetical protein
MFIYADCSAGIFRESAPNLLLLPRKWAKRAKIAVRRRAMCYRRPDAGFDGDEFLGGFS